MRCPSSPVPPAGGVPIPPAALAATYPLRCFAPQWARFDNRHSTSAPTPTLAVVSGSGASGTSDPPNRQCYPPHFMRECIPPNLHDPQRAKGSLNRRFEWFSLVTFFLQKKKVTRAGARNAPSRARRRNTCSPPGQRSTHPAPAGKKAHKKTASRRPFSCLEPCPWRRARRRQLKRHGLSRLRVPERHACRPQRDRRVRLRRVPVPSVAHQRHPP